MEKIEMDGVPGSGLWGNEMGESIVSAHVLYLIQ